MNQERLLKVLLQPHVSEKASYGAGHYQQYIFKVISDANKFEIKEAVEHVFSVRVKSVKTCNVKGEIARKFGRAVGKKASWKKAYVQLEPGHEISSV